ncbi:hypothetical protein Trihar35433_8647 [Trichoderma harzianum]|nr:hypothetical protein Trihar35433_8647 [Trichoderma harzianum]
MSNAFALSLIPLFDVCRVGSLPHITFRNITLLVAACVIITEAKWAKDDDRYGFFEKVYGSVKPTIKPYQVIVSMEEEK